MGVSCYLTPMNAEAIKRVRAFGGSVLLKEDLPSVFIGKSSWLEIHNILCGKAEANRDIMAQVILGGEEIVLNLGYDPARLIDPACVRRIAAHLECFTVTDFRERTLSREWLGADIWSDEDFPEEVAHLMELYAVVRQTYLDAAKRGYAMLAYLI
jgi:hypothetical protein